jgi:hypothetical protein
METRTSGTAAPSGAMRPSQRPEDAATRRSEEEDPFADTEEEQEDGGVHDDGAESAEFGENPGKKLCEHVISSGEDSGENSFVIMEEDEENGEGGVMQSCEPDPDQRPELGGEESDDMTVDEEETAPAAASTPLRDGTQQFRIVDIERPVGTTGQGDVNSAEQSGTPAPTVASSNISDVNSAKTSGDVNSTKAGNKEMRGDKNIPPRSDDQMARQSKEVSKPDPPATGSGCGAGVKDKKGNDSGRKVPSMVPPPKIPPKIPQKNVNSNTEKDAIPSDTYKSILAAKISRITPATIPGTGSGVADTSCGSFYNPGDNRIRRAVYKENVANLTVTSMGFNPVTWECASCPSRHPILNGDNGDDGGEGQLSFSSRIRISRQYCLLPPENA